MKITKVIASLGVLFLLSGLILSTSTHAQEPESKQIEAGVGDQADVVGTFGLGNLPPPGYQVLYMFTGVRNKYFSNNVITSIHCTNYNTADVTIIVQFFDNDAANVYPAQKTLASNQTWTFSTQDSAVYGSNETAANSKAVNIRQGSGRVLVDNTNIICTVQIHAPAPEIPDMPQFVAKLHLFDSDGNCVSHNCHYDNKYIYLPIIFKRY